jgi:Tol biopolymer transport system component
MLIAVLVLGACKCDGGGGGSGGGNAGGGSGAGGGNATKGLVSLTLAPANATLTVHGATAATQAYTAKGHFTDGHDADVTSSTVFSLADGSLGTFSAANFTFSTSRGGTTQVLATAGGVSANTNVTVVLQQIVKDPGSPNLPVDPGSLFGGPTTGMAPDLVYPSDGTLFPPNLGRLEIHFMPGSGNTVFELHFSNMVTDVKVYLQCTNMLAGGCIYQPDATVWSYVASTNRGGAPVQLTLRGTDASGTAVGTSTSINISFSQDDINGGLYYWTTSSGTAIMRYDFASTTQTAATQFIGTQFTGGTCVGCHALSPDGTKLVAEAGGQNDGRVLLMDVGHGMPLTPFPTAGKSIFESWAPDGSKYVGVYGDTGATNWNLLLFDGTTGAPLSPADIPGTGTQANPADHPSWSNDGLKIVFTHVGSPQTMQRPFNGSIQMVTTADGTTWSTPVELAAAVPGKNRYYPAFAPDDSFVLFDESTCASAGTLDKTCDADTDNSALLMAVNSAAGSPVIPLVKANAPGKMDNGNTNVTDSFPKWSPFVFQRSVELGSRLMWVTFSSTRRYGLRSPVVTNGDESATGTLLWMAAIDPDKVGQGIDPSYPAFALPFQDLTTSNHIAQWTKVVVPPIN